MDDFKRKKYKVDPVSTKTIPFRAPKELVDREDILVCIEYEQIARPAVDDGGRVNYWVWCRVDGADQARIVHKGVAPIGRFCGSSAAVEERILNGVLQSAKAIRAVQRFAGTKNITKGLS